MATGIGQQIKDMVGRARHYWAELTDEKDSRQQAQHQREEEEVHQRYGGVRSQDMSPDTDLRGGANDMADRIPPHASPPRRAAHGGQAAQMGERPGGKSEPPHQMQGNRQTQRQYTQQGGNDIQKTLGEQLGGNDSGSGKLQDRRPGPQRR